MKRACIISLIVIGQLIFLEGHVHYSRTHFSKLLDKHGSNQTSRSNRTDTINTIKKSNSSEICDECPGSGVCLPYVQCPAHVRETKKIECHLKGDKEGLCCTTGQNHTALLHAGKKGRESSPFVPDVEALNACAKSSRIEVDELMEREMTLFNSGNHAVVSPGSASYGHYRNFRVPQQSELVHVRGLAEKALEVTLATRVFKNRESISNEDMELGLFQANLGPTPLGEACIPPPFCTNVPDKHRSIDGTCNNAFNPKWGMATSPFSRVLPPYYEDGIWSPRQSSIDKTPLPSARAISSALFFDNDRPHSSHNLLFMQFGQFISHDIARTMQNTFPNGNGISCCTEDGRYELPSQFRHYSCMPITISPNDPFFKDYGQGCMNFVRSILTPRHDCSLGYAQQMNKVTHFLDASMVYGSDTATITSVRAFEGGRLRVFNDFGRDLMPLTEHTDDCITMERGSACFFAGDARSNQMISLVALHTIFIREHNRIANELQIINPHWTDDTIFLEARRIVIAELQHITFNEFLPALIGESAMDEFKLKVNYEGYLSDYDPQIDPSITNEFASAAYRLHTIVDGRISIYSENKMEEVIDISEVMFHPAKMRYRQFFDELLNSLTSQPMQQFDSSISDMMTKYMFRGGNPFGVDIGSINIQRGRDHGLRPYNDYRELVGLPRISIFEEYVPEIADVLRQLYASPDDIDLYVGGLLEEPGSDSIVGITFRDIIADQFSRIRKGDKYFYEHGPDTNPGFFTLDQLREIKKITMGRLICENSDKIMLGKQSPRAFHVPVLEGNEYIDCDSTVLPRLNLIYWKEYI